MHTALEKVPLGYILLIFWNSMAHVEHWAESGLLSIPRISFSRAPNSGLVFQRTLGMQIPAWKSNKAVLESLYNSIPVNQSNFS